MKTLFTWIHLSDLQIGREHADATYPWSPGALLRALRDDAVAQSRWHPVNALFVTGDVALGGKRAEYEAARVWLNDLARAVGLDARRVFVVPGNHDVDRSADADAETARLLRALRGDAGRLDGALAHGPDRDRLSERMAAFLDFAADLAPACLAHPAPPRASRLFWVHPETHGALRLRILGLNTALLAADDHDRRQLALGEAQIGLALREPRPGRGELVIALGHHPVHATWLADARDAVARMYEHVHVHLSGHIHDLTSAVPTSGPGGHAIRVGAGIVRPPTGAPPGYRYLIGSVLVGARGRLHVLLSSRRWSASHEAFVEEEDVMRDRLPSHENPLAPLWPIPESTPAAAAASLLPRSPSLMRRLMQTVERVWRPAARGLPVATALRSAAPAPRRPRRRPPTPAPPPRSLGRLRLVEQLWRGGLGTIWRAHDPQASEDVAVKVLHRHLAASPAVLGRFFRSARIMAELAHPNVVRIREPEASDQGCSYYVMDYFAHGTLHDAVLRERLLRSQIEPLVLSVARVLATAHERGIVHREIKPTHILFSPANTPCLIDFDLPSAEHVLDDAPGLAAGVYAHVAPELGERPHQADARADVYGLGMTMAFMLYGAPLPHDAARAPERFVRGLPCEPPLRRVLERAVARDPAHRFPHAGAFCQALEEAMGRFRDATAIKLVAPGAAPDLRGIPLLLRFLRSLDDNAWMHSPVLARLDMDPAAAVEHARVRQQDMREWRLPRRSDQPDRSALRRLEYLVREWAFASVHPLVPATPAAAPGTPVTIGRSRSCDVLVRGSTISKIHAAVVFDPDAGGYRITDQGSRHGTRVDGEKLPAGASALLASGNLVTLGTSIFVFFEPRLLRRLAKAV
jgi:hypothetical protein